MGLTDYLLYQKNKVLAGGNTEKEMEYNRREMELRDKREMDKRIREEQQRRVQLAREQAKQEYDLKYAQEEEKLKYERKLAQAKSGKQGGILGMFLNRGSGRATVRGRAYPQPKRKVNPLFQTSNVLDKFSGPPKKKKGGIDMYKI